MQCLIWIESGCIVLENSMCKLLLLVIEDEEYDVTIVLQAFGQLQYMIQKLCDRLEMKTHEWIGYLMLKVRNGNKMKLSRQF